MIQLSFIQNKLHRPGPTDGQYHLLPLISGKRWDEARIDNNIWNTQVTREQLHMG